MGLEGRGRHYPAPLGALEAVLAPLYRSGWPARWAHALGFQRIVRRLDHEVPLAHWPAAVPPLSVAFASDLHSGPTTHPSVLERACREITAAEPHALLLGGDYIYLHARYIDALAEMLGAVPAPLGRFAVMGNHDLWADDRYIVDRMERAGVQILVNRCVTLPPPYAHVTICGLDEPWTGSPDPDAALAGDGVRILLMHTPDGLSLVGDRRFDLALSGHTHGGHIALPGGIPIVVPPGRLCRRYNHGRFSIGPSTLIVSRGIGCVEAPFRLNADPDVLVCRLHGLGDGANSR